jgi:hypothetical protein
MTEPEPKPAAPPAEPPKAPEPPKPAPAPPPVVDNAKARAEAEYYARHPEQLDATLRQLEQAGVIQVRQEVNELRLEIDLRDIIADTGLTKEDIPFIKAGSREEMIAKAEALKRRLGTVTPPPAPGATDEKIVPVGHMGVKPVPATEAPPPPPAISEVVRGQGGVPSVEAAKDAFFKSMEGVKFEDVR